MWGGILVKNQGKTVKVFFKRGKENSCSNFGKWNFKDDIHGCHLATEKYYTRVDYHWSWCVSGLKLYGNVR